MITGARVVCSASILTALAAASALAQVPAAPPAEPGVTQPPSAPETGPQPAPAPIELDAVVVTGLRESLSSAQAIKRDSDQIIDSIVAEDIGKLPDITASASLARIAGVQVTRAAGEAAGVQIRGLPDFSTTYNGREIFTAEGRNVALQDFPAGGVAGLDVYKSSTANLIEGGIGGQINVRSRQPFDFDGLEMFGAFNGIYTDQANKYDWNGNFLVSNRWDTGVGEMGLLLNVSYTRLRFLDSTREESLVVGVANANQTDQPGFRFPDAMDISYGEGERSRPSANAAFQFKPTDELEIHADALFQGFRGRDSGRLLFVPLFGDDISFSNVVLQTGTNQAQSLTATGGIRPDGFQSSVDGDTDTYQFAVGAIYHRNGLRISSDIAYTDTKFTLQAANVDYAFASTPVVDVNFDVPGDDGGPSFSFRDFDLTDPTNFVFRGLFDRNFEASGDDLQARSDLEYDTESGVITQLQAGVRFSDRDAERRNGERLSFQEPEGILYTELPLDLELIDPGFRGSDFAPPRIWISPTRDSIRNNINQLRVLAGFPAGPPPFNDLQTFTANEKAYSAYGQFKYAFDLGIALDGAVGLRVVKTETEVSGTSREILDGVETFAPVARGNDYADYLPNASARLLFTDKLQLRLAATRTRTRPNFDQLNPSTLLDPPSSACTIDPTSEDCFRNAFAGNPDLRPLESKNYDLSLEYYFSPAGSATLALFRRDINGFISQSVVEEPDPVFRVLRTNRPENGGDGTLQGVEAAFATFLDFESMPEWARGFGVQANYTYIDGEAELGPTLGAALPGRQRIPGVSKNAYNLILLYEKPKFSARLAYNYRSDFVVIYEQIFDPGINATGPTLPLIEDGRGVLDFAMTFTPMPSVTFAFDVTNILGEPVETSRAYNAEGDSFPRSIRYLERVYSLGVRFRF